MPVRVLVVGAGAIGAFFGSRLAILPNVLVSALCRSNYQAVKRNGLKVTSPKFGDYTFIPEFTFASPNEAQRTKRQHNLTWDYLLVATKSLPDVSDDSSLVESLVSDKTSIVLIQNGLGIEEPFRRRFARATILSAVTIASAAQPQHGLIRHNRWTKISIGPYLPPGNSASAGLAHERAQTLVDLFIQSGISDAELYDHAGTQFVRWHKIAINGAMNPSAVLSGGAGNRELVLDPEGCEHVKGVINEVLAVASKILGKPLPSSLATADQIIASVSRNTTGSRPSMWHDWEKGKKMELEVILGNPVRIAREHGLEMPRLQSMYALLKKAQARREAESRNSKL